MTRRLALFFTITAAVSIAAAALRAATPTFWLVATQADFLRGEADNLSIDSDGRLTLGPATELLAETTAPFLWTLVPTSDGGYWAGSGNEGKVYRVDRAGKTTVFFDAPELEVHAIAAAPDGGLFVGTSPDGKVYRVAADGSSKVLFDPEDKYIWALAVDRDGAVFVATGDKGVIYRVAPDGKGAAFYRTRTAHVLTLAMDASGRLLAATESPGRVFRFDKDAKAFVLLDSPFREIRALRLAPDGTVYAAAVSARPGAAERPADRPSEPARPAPVPTVSTEITSISLIEGAAGGDEPTASRAETRRAARGAIYRILSDGLWDVVWESPDDAPYDVLVEPGGTLLVATGSSGKLFRLSGDPAKQALIARADAQQITWLVKDAEARHVFATANPGKIFRLSRERARSGTFESDVRDASTVATWGAIRWRAAANGGRVDVSTRSGNTATPDDTWSAWSATYRNANGDQIVSPKARYLQWRAVLTAGDADRAPVLTSVGAAYLPRNLRPEVVSITVHQPGVVFQRPFSSGDPEIAGYDERSDARPPGAAAPSGPAAAPSLGRRMYQKGLQTFVWKAEDGNDDRLQYDVLYRREGETGWKPIKGELSDPIVVWDTTSVPDGTYVIKVAATDAPTNSPGTALVGERESGSFEVDNTAPRISVAVAGTGTPAPALSFTVEDGHSAVQRVEYSVEGSRWRTIYPKDGIADSRTEAFELSAEEAAGRTVIIRASDVMNNVATATARSERR